MDGTTVLMSLIFTLPFLKNIFQFGNVSITDVLLALSGGVIAIAFMELLKLIPSIAGSDLTKENR